MNAKEKIIQEEISSESSSPESPEVQFQAYIWPEENPQSYAYIIPEESKGMEDKVEQPQGDEEVVKRTSSVQRPQFRRLGCRPDEQFTKFQFSME